MRCNFLAFVAFTAGALAQILFWGGLIVGVIGFGIFVVWCAATALTACFVGAAIMVVGALMLLFALGSGVVWLASTMEYRRSCP